MKVQWTEKARKRLREIEAYLIAEECTPIRASKLIFSITRKTSKQLADYPQSGRPGRVKNTRELFFSDSPFLVVYTARKQTVTVLSVYHTAQQIPTA
ncbi:type II toxin-antitoxin system RelE/ParE family toxin [Chlorobaculum sp. 24CR]|uniref:type II toxin-antitoxin system RelE/ParE family toxin n=1 Tax=Chlorobaculum sp. 24CR TaxID=2508878 RepID=UPI00100BCBC1|nr:type II toxin-antitoxin system RelE/ParE family toxin [Chlorobaculum sp. 24CR]RXK82342.1 type II toxin-antitoxin system RelE/ParE family toxin [Chlorobaculum sp. 24CR]